jgi:hypothetical protein
MIPFYLRFKLVCLLGGYVSAFELLLALKSNIVEFFNIFLSRRKDLTSFVSKKRRFHMFVLPSNAYPLPLGFRRLADTHCR